MLELELGTEMEMELNPSDKYSALHPWCESTMRRKAGQGVDHLFESGGHYYRHSTNFIS